MPFEFAILDLIQKISSPVLDSVMVGISAMGNKGIIWIITALILLFTKKYRKYGIMLAGALIIDLFFVDILIKPIVQRARPYTVNDFKIIIPLLHDYSFPSGHTASSFAAVTVLFFADKKIGLVGLVVAVLIAFSRLYLYVHYPTDVLAGLVLGVCFGMASVFIFNVVKTVGAAHF